MSQADFEVDFDWADIEENLATLEEEDNILQAKWFFPAATRAEADTLLHGARPRVFLVRPSSQEGSYALSMKRSNGDIIHTVIEKRVSTSGDVQYEIAGAPDAYPTITLLVSSLDLVPLVRPDYAQPAALTPKVPAMARVTGLDESARSPSGNRASLSHIAAAELSSAASKLRSVAAPERKNVLLTDTEQKRAEMRKVRRRTTSYVDYSSAGWIAVNGSRQWCVLDGTSFVYFTPDGAAEVGRLALLGARVRVISDVSVSIEFASGKKDPLTLVFASGKMARAWVHMLGKAIVDARVKPSGDVAQLDGDGEFRGVLTDAATGKSCWYVLRGGYLMRFSKLSCGAVDAYPLAGAAFAPLEDSHSAFGFRLELADSAGVFELHCPSEAYSDVWRAALEDAVEVAESPSAKNSITGDYCKKAGWMSKKGKRRFFVLHEDSLLWLDKEIDGGKITLQNSDLIKGGMTLAHAAVFPTELLMRGADKRQRSSLSAEGKSTFRKLFSSNSNGERIQRLDCAFTIAMMTGAVRTLEADTPEEMQEWVTAMTKNAARASRLSDPAVAHSLEKGTKASEPHTVSTSGWVSQVASAGSTTLKAGNGKRRWYVLRDELLLGYEHAEDVGEKPPATSLSIRGASAREVEERQALLVTADGEIVVLEPEGAPDKRLAWMEVFAVAFRRANRQRVGGGSRAAGAVTTLKAGVTTVKNAKRFTELKYTSLTWFKKSDARNRGDVLGAVGLANCLVEKLARPPNAFAVRTESGKRHMFLCASSEEQESWVAMVTKQIEITTEEHQSHYIAARKHQEELLEILTSPLGDFGILRVLFKVYGNDAVARAALNVCMSQKVHLALMDTMIRSELSSSVSVGTLFRGDSSATKLCREFLKTMGRRFLVEALGQHIQKIVSVPRGLEVDPNKIAPGEVVEDNVQRLDAVCEMVLDSILEAASLLPTQVFIFFENAKSAAEEYFPGSYHKVAAGFLFLRFLCPAIFSPVFFKLMTKQPERESQRALTLVSKVLQNLANGVQFGKKEPSMAPLNAFVTRNADKIGTFFDDLASGKITKKKAQVIVEDGGNGTSMTDSSASITRDEATISAAADEDGELTMVRVAGEVTTDKLESSRLANVAILVRQLSDNFKAMEKEMEKSPETYVESLGNLLRLADICGIDSSVKKMSKTGAVIDIDKWESYLNVSIRRA